MRFVNIASTLKSISLFLSLTLSLNFICRADDFIVYEVYRGVNLGNPGEPPPPKDFYINMGSLHSIHKGDVLEVLRKAPSYDLLNEQYYKDVLFPIALVKVIHADPTTAITRLEKMLPLDQTPAISPRTIMVGDLVRIPNSQ